ncbi:MAG TPA: glycosyltransferase [Anaerolineales bacterium]|nr:glycosyltransferase [Anaerolineales bacterium]
MHIGHFTNTYVPTISGVVRQVSALRKAHLDLGHQVSVFTQNVRGNGKPEANIFRYPTSTFFKMPMEFPVILPYSLDIDRRLRSLQMDVIHTHHPFILGKVALSKAEELHLPVVFTFHTQYWEHSHFFPLHTGSAQELVKKFIHFRLRWFLKRCHLIVVYTESMRDLLVQKFGTQHRIEVVPTGIDLSNYQNVYNNGYRERMGWMDKQIMISVGRLSPEKNWILLLDAARQVMQTHPSFRLVLIGDGPQRAALENYARVSGISRQVTFTGWVSFDESPAYLKAADLFGFASTTETIGRVTMEAMAAGLPVVAVDAVGTRDLVTDGREVLLSENDSHSLARNIRVLLDNLDIRKQFGQAACLKAGNYDVKNEAKKMLYVYYNAIESYGEMNG